MRNPLVILRSPLVILSEAKNLMNWELFHTLLSIDSTSGKERAVADWLLEHLEAPSKQAMEVGDGTLNLLFSWGTPKVVFCTHMDTVPPYIAPSFPEKRSFVAIAPQDDKGRPDDSSRHSDLTPCHSDDSSCHSDLTSCHSDVTPCHSERSEESIIKGRGACDAKGQIIAMYTACKELEAVGKTDFGLLLLSGEETGSWGAKAFAKTDFRAPFLIVGEPTENKMVSAAKGTKSYDLRFTGAAFHSGYPQYGTSAIDLFNDFYNKLKAKDFGRDPELGETSWNIGLLHSDNPQNILSPELSCRLYFRTTFVSDQAVQDWMQEMAGLAGHDVTPDPIGGLKVTPRGGDSPARYVTLPGFASAPVAFGSDAPHLSNFGHKIICGPGSIRHAHRDDEQIQLSELEEAVALYKRMYEQLLNG